MKYILFLRFYVQYQCVNADFGSCVAAILIKILLEITLFDFMFTTRGSNDCVFSMIVEIIRTVFKLVFSRHQCLIDYLVKIYKAASNFAELVSKIQHL